MSDPFGDRPFPKAALAGAGGLVILTLALVAFSGPTSLPEELPPTQTRNLVFKDAPGGDIVVIDADSDQSVATIDAGTEGFLRATLRNLAGDRKLAGAGAEVPFTLYRRHDGRIGLTDPVTDRRVILDAFGQTNVQTFTRLLESTSTPQEKSERES